VSAGPPPSGSRGVPVGRLSLLLVPLALASRGAAFLIPIAVAAWFGVGPITDAWYWALAFPTFALVLASTSLGTAVIPALSRVESEAPARVASFVGGIACWTAILAALAGTGICLLAPLLLPRITDFDPATAARASTFLWELLPFMVLTSTGAVLRVSCEVRGLYRAVALTPLLRAATVIGATALLLPWLDAHALPWGLVAGEALQVGWWAALLARAGLRPVPNLRLDPAVVGVARDLGPILGGEMLVALNLVVDKGFAAWLPSGAVATLEYADRARVIPQTLLESTLLMVSFATWSRLRAEGAMDEARRSMGQSMLWTAAIAAPCLAGMYIGRSVIVSLLYERGAFGPEDVQATATVLGWYVPGILPNLIGILAVRAHVVERNLRLVLVLGAVSLSVNCLLNALLIGPMGLSGLALATTLNMVVVPGIYLHQLRGSLAVEGAGRVGALAGLAALVAIAVELGPGAPRSLADPVLWGAALACVGLLAAGMGLGRRAGGRPR
jgi:putative peptidoglycan lipid II flippase